MIYGFILAIRPKTLPLSLIPVLIASALAFREKRLDPKIVVLCLCFSLLIQIGTNLANDYFDHQKGADTQKKKGPKKVLQAGILKEKEIQIGFLLTFFFAFLCSIPLMIKGGWVFILLALLSIFLGILYTAGNFSLSYTGLADVFVFIFFGIVATCGTYFLQTNQITLLSFLLCIPPGCLATSVLVMNNLRDLEEDKKVNKRTLPVRFGKTFGIGEFVFCLLLPYTVPLILNIFFSFSIAVYLPYLLAPFAVLLVRKLQYSKTFQNEEILFEKSGMHALFFSFLFFLGILI